MAVNEFSLLLGCERDHAESVTGMECRKDSIVDSEIRVAHVGAFTDTVEGQRHAPEIIWPHAGSP